MSFGTAPGTTPSHVVTSALAYAYAHGVVLAAAAADEPVEDQGYPANVLQPMGTGATLSAGKGLSVTAADASDARATFAGRGSQISLAAYGAYRSGRGPRGIFGAFTGTIPSQLERPGLTLPPRDPCLCRTSFGGDARYAYLQGTSMATPVVAAAGALVRRMNPDLGVAEVLQVLKRTARRRGAGWSRDLGWGILDAGAAVRAAAAIDRRPPASRLRAAARRTRARSVTLRWTGRDPQGPPGVAVSGVARYEVWRSVDGAAWRRMARVGTRTLRLPTRLVPGARHAYATVAVDAAGNREPLPARPDARVTSLRPRAR
jgi:subtilisin family serine protease